MHLKRLFSRFRIRTRPTAPGTRIALSPGALTGEDRALYRAALHEALGQDDAARAILTAEIAGRADAVDSARRLLELQLRHALWYDALETAAYGVRACAASGGHHVSELEEFLYGKLRAREYFLLSQDDEHEDICAAQITALASDLDSFLQDFPNGIFAKDAEAHRKLLRRRFSSIIPS